MTAKRLMVVAGGEWQVPIIRKAKAMGLFVINTNLYPDSPGFRYADVGLVADVLDHEKQLAFARVHRPHAILTDQSDVSVGTAAYLCEQLGLPGIGVDHAALFTNKHLMREFLRQHKYPTPAFQLCSSADEAAAFAHSIGYPVVLKPPASQASRGVFRVLTAEELRQHFGSALAFSRDKTVLVEQFIEGTELTVEGMKTIQAHHTLAISRKQHYEHNPMVASELLYTPEDEEIDFDRLRVQHNDLIVQMGLPFGITHTEYIHSRGTFYLVETAARGGGTRISSDVVPAVSGIATNELLISLALGENVKGLPEPGPRLPFAVLGFFDFPNGKVESISGFQEAESLPGVLAAGLTIRPGDLIKPPADDVGRHGYFIAAAASREALALIDNRARSTIRVTYA